MTIGYACLTIGVPATNMRTCRIANANDKILHKLISHNLQALENMIDYNIDNNVKLFRITSDIIPFGSSPVIDLNWEDLFFEQFNNLSRKIGDNGIRISMHPGQYTVLNSPRKEVVARAVEDLNYHLKVIHALGGDNTNKIILHIGGVYGDKTRAIQRFIFNYKSLDENVKKYLVIENDDRSYTIEDVLGIGEKLDIPVVFDNLHYAINDVDTVKDDLYWINRCKQTWENKDGRQKIHYSQQDPLKKPGAHSQTIKFTEFIDYYNSINGKDLDIMLEVKDKNLSAIKCINILSENNKIKMLEQEWAKYKYSVLEKSPEIYHEIRQLLKDKSKYKAVEFYQLIEDALEEGDQAGNIANGILHVWGYFKNLATDKEKEKFLAC